MLTMRQVRKKQREDKRLTVRQVRKKLVLVLLLGIILGWCLNWLVVNLVIAYSTPEYRPTQSEAKKGG